jgi:hypothetical protein
MTHDPIIVSVPHTGTRFLQQRLGLQEHIHTLSSWDSLLRKLAGRKVYIPLRNPPDVWRSWCRRHNPKIFPYGQFFLAWGCLQMIAEQMEVDVICVDHKTDPRINDWGKVGDQDNSKVGWQLLKTDLRPLYRLPLVDKYYGPHSKWQREQQQDAQIAVI